MRYFLPPPPRDNDLGESLDDDDERGEIAEILRSEEFRNVDGTIARQ